MRLPRRISSSTLPKASIVFKKIMTNIVWPNLKAVFIQIFHQWLSISSANSSDLTITNSTILLVKISAGPKSSPENHFLFLKIILSLLFSSVMQKDITEIHDYSFLTNPLMERSYTTSSTFFISYLIESNFLRKLSFLRLRSRKPSRTS